MSNKRKNTSSSKINTAILSLLRIARESFLVLRHWLFLFIFLFELLILILLYFVIWMALKVYIDDAVIFVLMAFILASLYYVYFFVITLTQYIHIKKRFGETDIMQSVKSVLSNLILANVVALISYIIGIAIFVLPGIAVHIYLTFINQIIIVEKESFIKAIKESVLMVHRSFWKIVFSISIFYIITFIIFYINKPLISITTNTCMVDLSVFGILRFLLSVCLGLYYQVFITKLYLHLKESEERSPIVDTEKEPK